MFTNDFAIAALFIVAGIGILQDFILDHRLTIIEKRIGIKEDDE